MLLRAEIPGSGTIAGRGLTAGGPRRRFTNASKKLDLKPRSWPRTGDKILFESNQTVIECRDGLRLRVDRLEHGGPADHAQNRCQTPSQNRPARSGPGRAGSRPRRSLALDGGDQRPERFAVGEKVDARVTAIDQASRRLTLSIKALEFQEEKQAMSEYGSSNSGASLGDILGAAIDKAEEKRASEAVKKPRQDAVTEKADAPLEEEEAAKPKAKTKKAAAKKAPAEKKVAAPKKAAATKKPAATKKAAAANQESEDD